MKKKRDPNNIELRRDRFYEAKDKIDQKIAHFFEKLVDEEKKKNFPNRLSKIRIICTPFIIVAGLISTLFATFATALIFITDYLDGALARGWDVKSEEGAFLDVLGDKISVLCVLIASMVGNMQHVILYLLPIVGEVSILNQNVKTFQEYGTTKTERIGKEKNTVLMVYAIMLLLQPLIQNKYYDISTYTMLGLTTLMQSFAFLKYRKNRMNPDWDMQLNKVYDTMYQSLSEQKKKEILKTEQYQELANTNYLDRKISEIETKEIQLGRDMTIFEKRAYLTNAKKEIEHIYNLEKKQSKQAIEHYTIPRAFKRLLTKKQKKGREHL